MFKLNEAIKEDLKVLAEKHGMTYDALVCIIGAENDKINRYEDIRYVLGERYADEIALTDENVEMIYEVLERKEDAEYGVWDNINTAIDYCYDDLEKVGGAE